MVARRPLVSISGSTTELPPGDSVVGLSPGTLTAGSGLNGGGDLSANVNLNILLAPNPSGLIFADGKLGVDGAVRSIAAEAVASGNYSLAVSSSAIASGLAGEALANAAIASGTAALVALDSAKAGVLETFTAASAIASGYAVGLDDSGRVQSINAVSDNTTREFGTAVVYEAGQARDNAATFDSLNNKIVIGYYDNNNSAYGTAVVGTVSGNSVSFGSPVVFRSAATNTFAATYDSTNNKVVLAYRDASGYGTAIVGTVSGTSISFGTSVVFQSVSATFTTATYDSTNDRVVIAYRNGSNLHGTAVVGTVSGTSISFGTPVSFESSSTDYIASSYDSSNGKVVIAYRDVSNSLYGTSIIGTVSGTSISFGTPVVFASVNSIFNCCEYDSVNDKIVIIYRDDTNSSISAGIVGTVSGTSISFGTRVTFGPTLNYYNYVTSTYDPANAQVLFSYQAATNSNYGSTVICTVSGTSISFTSPIVFEEANVNYLDSTYDSTNNATVICYADLGNSSYGTAIAATTPSSLYPTISSQNNFIGIAQNTVASGSSVPVRLPGSYDQNNTGLTPGAVYYVDPTTSGFTTTATQPAAWSGAVNWGPVGRAVNSTTLLLTDMI